MRHNKSSATFSEKELFLGLFKTFILGLTEKLNTETQKIQVASTNENIKEVLDKCHNIVGEMNDRIEQLEKSLLH